MVFLFLMAGITHASAQSSAGLYYEFRKKADLFYFSGKYREAAGHYMSASNLRSIRTKSDDLYNAACCLALSNGKDSAFMVLTHLVTDLGYADYDHLSQDQDLYILHQEKKWQDVLGLVAKNKKIDADAGISDIAILAFLKDNWMNIRNPDAFEKTFHELFYPFVNYIFEDQIPENTLAVLKQFEGISRKYHVITQSRSVTDYLESQGLGRLLQSTEESSLQQRLCEEYLQMGISSVLAGMRKPEYVDDYKRFFSKPLAQSQV